jgi:hypothetical protein
MIPISVLRDAINDIENIDKEKDEYGNDSVSTYIFADHIKYYLEKYYKEQNNDKSRKS